jgi:hypothetical protein
MPNTATFFAMQRSALKISKRQYADTNQSQLNNKNDGLTAVFVCINTRLCYYCSFFSSTVSVASTAESSAPSACSSSV